MNYRITVAEVLRAPDTVELHVLARAYAAAWKSLYGTEPSEKHLLPDLGVAIVYRTAVNGTDKPDFLRR